jgi:protoheme IX farnesyltransferase
MGETIRLYYGLFKLRIGFAIMLCALAGIAITPGAAPSAGQITALALAVLLASAAAGAFNQYAERDLDVRMRRTRARPFVTGRLRAGPRWLVGLATLLLVAVLLAVAATNLHAALYTFLGAFVYGVVYTLWLKRRTWLNIVIGGLAGSFAVLAGAAAVDPQIAPAPLVLAVVLFLWTPPHFWSLALAYRDDYAAAGVPMLPVVVGGHRAARVIFAHTVSLVLLSLLPFAYGAGWLYLAGAVTGGAWFVWTSYQLTRCPDRVHAIRNFHASLGQLGLLLAASLLAPLGI